MVSKPPIRIDPPADLPAGVLDYVPYKLLRSECVAIGRIITAASEIEQVITIAFFKVIKLDPLDCYNLFGASSIGSRLVKLRSALKYKDEYIKERQEFKKQQKEISQVIDAPNMFAHGTLTGIHDECLCYTITNNIEITTENDSFVIKIKRIITSEITPRAYKAEIVLERLRFSGLDHLGRDYNLACVRYLNLCRLGHHLASGTL